MLSNRDTFLKNHEKEGLAICGIHIKEDAIHTGLFWNSEDEKMVIHFLNGDRIPVTDVSNESFKKYLFNPLPNFPTHLIPSLAAIADLISQNKLNGFIFNRVGTVYNGGKFEYQTGAYTHKSAAEKFVNCAVFVIALLNTFDYTLLDWNSWPDTNQANLGFLNTWLDENHIAAEVRKAYYNQTKEVRGKHVLVSPDTHTKPAPYNEVKRLADELVNHLTP